VLCCLLAFRVARSCDAPRCVQRDANNPLDPAWACPMRQLWELKDRNVMRDVSYPSVFIYDLPPGFNARFLPGSPVRRPPNVRPEMDLLHERLLSSKHRVATGDAADFYFIPLNLAGVRAPVGAYVQARHQPSARVVYFR
jgi:hypothetical protein